MGKNIFISYLEKFRKKDFLYELKSKAFTNTDQLAKSQFRMNEVLTFKIQDYWKTAYELACERYETYNEKSRYHAYKHELKWYKTQLNKFRTKNFNKLLYELLLKSKKQTPQFVSVSKSKDLYDTLYSSNHTENFGHYPYKYCKKTRVNYFKWKLEEAKKIQALGYKDLYSYAFVYGYIFFALDLLFRVDVKKNKIISTLKEEKIYNNLFKQLFKLNEYKSKSILEDLNASIYKSNLTKFLLYKKEKYFFGGRRPLILYPKNNLKEGFSNEIRYIIHFLFKSSVTKKRKIFEFKTKEDRLNLAKLRKIYNKRRWSLFETFYDQYIIFDFGVIKFFTLLCPMSTPFTAEELEINDRDIFIRYAANMGFYEASFYFIDNLMLMNRSKYNR